MVCRAEVELIGQTEMLEQADVRVDGVPSA